MENEDKPIPLTQEEFIKMLDEFVALLKEDTIIHGAYFAMEPVGNGYSVEMKAVIEDIKGNKFH